MGSSNPAWSAEERAAQRNTVSWPAPPSSHQPPTARAPSASEAGALTERSPGLPPSELAEERLPVLEAPKEGQCLVLRPGEVPELRSRRRLGAPTGVWLAPGELVLVDGMRRHHFRTPVAPTIGKARWPVAAKLVSIGIRHRPAGRRSHPVRLVCVLDASDEVIGQLDVSDKWELRSDALAGLAGLAGIGYEVYRFDEARELLASHPQWAPAELEWFVNHEAEETGREWAWGLWLGGSYALALGTAGMFAIILSPVGRAYIAMLLAAGVVFGVMTAWSRSRWRMRRSLRRAGYTGVAVIPRSRASAPEAQDQLEGDSAPAILPSVDPGQRSQCP